MDNKEKKGDQKPNDEQYKKIAIRPPFQIDINKSRPDILLPINKDFERLNELKKFLYSTPSTKDNASVEGTSDVKHTFKKGKKDDQSAKPTPALTAYSFYINQKIPKIKYEDPSLRHKDAMRQAADCWHHLNNTQKKKFNELHDADVKRYEKQLDEYKRKGYYLMEGGIKSTDLADPKKRKEKSDSEPDVKNKRSSSAAVAGKAKQVENKQDDVL